MVGGVEQKGSQIPSLVESLEWGELAPLVDFSDQVARFLEVAGFGKVIDVGTISPISEPHGPAERNSFKAEFAAKHFKPESLEGLVDKVKGMDALTGVARGSVEKAVNATIHDLFAMASLVRDGRYGAEVARFVLVGRLIPRLIRAESRTRVAGDGRVSKDVLDRIGSGPCPGSMTLPLDGFREILEFIENPDSRLAS